MESQNSSTSPSIPTEEEALATKKALDTGSSFSNPTHIQNPLKISANVSAKTRSKVLVLKPEEAQIVLRPNTSHGAGSQKKKTEKTPMILKIEPPLPVHH